MGSYWGSSNMGRGFWRLEVLLSWERYKEGFGLALQLLGEPLLLFPVLGREFRVLFNCTYFPFKCPLCFYIHLGGPSFS